KLSAINETRIDAPASTTPGTASVRAAISDAGDDAPLDALALAPSGAGTSGSSVRGSGGAEGGSTAGTATGNGSGVAGVARGSGQGGKDLFSRVADQMVSEQQRSSFMLKGQPAYPRSCRQGLCRHGVPCEGSSEWRVTVPAGGGTPTKIEAISQMDCELQNA